MICVMKFWKPLLIVSVFTKLQVNKTFEFSQLIIAASSIALARELAGFSNKWPEWLESLIYIKFGNIKDYFELLKR